MQEASSIAKAIEQGWLKAGNPVDFSVKILEEPKRNFFGLTVHPAKVAIYFDEKRPAQSTRQEPFSVAPSVAQRPRRPNTRLEGRDVRQEQPSRRQERPVQERPVREARMPQERRAAPLSSPVDVQPSAEKLAARQQFEAQWNEAMIGYTQDWMKEILQGVHRESITFTIEPNNLYLRITLNQPIMDSAEKEKRMLASLALLLLEALKRQFRVGLRRHKIILTHAAGQSPTV